MPAPTLTPGDKKQDELNPGQRGYDQQFDAGNFEKRLQDTPSQDDVERGLRDLENFSKDKSTEVDESIHDREAQGDTPVGSWVNKAQGTDKTSGSQTFRGRLLASFKKTGPILGIGGGLGVAGFILAGMFGVITMPISLMENMTSTNDSLSTSMQRRALKALGFTIDDTSTTLCSSTKIKCRMGRISNAALRQLDKKGVKAFFDDGSTYSGKRTGYPSKNPKGYTFDLGDGKTANVAAKDLPGYLQNNPKMAAKVLGRAGAFNFAVRGWAGKYITSKFFKVFGVKKDGGLADGSTKSGSSTNRFTDVLERLRKQIPGMSQIDGVADKIKTKISGHVGKAKKGGVGYTLAVASCIGIKAPAYVAAGVAAVQLAQLLPIANLTVLSPGAKLKASGADITNEVTMEEADEIGTLLTEKVPRESDGKATSALDSPYLLAAIGAGTGTLAISKFAPGFSTLTNPLVASSVQVDKATSEACNGIMSPAAMYTALAVDSAVTVATSFTVIGGVLKIAASLAVSEIAGQVIENVVPGLALTAIQQAAENDLVPKAKGEALGDVIGISGAALFSAGGMSRNLPTLKESQLSDYVAVQEENNNFQRDMDIATLSPFDTSSRYTFLGSIAHNFTMASIQNGTYGSGNIFSNMAALLQSPLALLSGTASADMKAIQNYCGYAESFGLAMDEANTPAINMAGMPCTGITTAQARMSTDEALNLIEAEGWLDDSKDIEDGATITDLVESGYIKSETPLADYIETCGDPASGDYLFNSGSCTVNSETKNTSAITALTGSCGINEDGEKACMSDNGTAVGAGDLGVKNPQSLEAIPVFLLDFQIIQSINGEDSTTSSTAFYDPETELTVSDVIAAYGESPSYSEVSYEPSATTVTVQTILAAVSTSKNFLQTTGSALNGVYTTYVPTDVIPTQTISYNTTWSWQQVGGKIV